MNCPYDTPYQHGVERSWHIENSRRELLQDRNGRLVIPSSDRALIRKERTYPTCTKHGYVSAEYHKCSEDSPCLSSCGER